MKWFNTKDPATKNGPARDGLMDLCSYVGVDTLANGAGAQTRLCIKRRV